MIIVCIVCIFSVLQKELSVSALQWQLDDLNCTHSKLKVLVRISALGIAFYKSSLDTWTTLLW